VGKTTIANLLVKHLRSKGCKTKYVWIKSLHTLAYLIDTIVSIAMRAKNSLFVKSFLGKLLLRMIPKEAVIIYLDVDLRTLSKRRPDIEYTADEVQYQIALYRLLAEKMREYFIDTTMSSIKDAEKKVVDYISARALY